MDSSISLLVGTNTPQSATAKGSGPVASDGLIDFATLMMPEAPAADESTVLLTDVNEDLIAEDPEVEDPEMSSDVIGLDADAVVPDDMMVPPVAPVDVVVARSVETLPGFAPLQAKMHPIEKPETVLAKAPAAQVMLAQQQVANQTAPVSPQGPAPTVTQMENGIHHQQPSAPNVVQQVNTSTQIPAAPMLQKQAVDTAQAAVFSNSNPLISDPRLSKMERQADRESRDGIALDMRQTAPAPAQNLVHPVEDNVLGQPKAVEFRAGLDGEKVLNSMAATHDDLATPRLAQVTASAGPASAIAGPAVPREVAQQLAVAVIKQGGGTTEIALNPAELGRVRLTLTAQDTAIVLVIQAERPETADMMRRHIDVLAQEFRSLGYGNTRFEFSDDASTQSQTTANQGGSGTSDDSALQDDEIIATQTSRRSDGSLDLRL